MPMKFLDYHCDNCIAYTYQKKEGFVAQSFYYKDFATPNEAKVAARNWLKDN